METLTSERCTACRRDSPRVTDAEVAELKPQIPEWTMVERDGIPRLERVFRFANFAEALAFTNRVGALKLNRMPTASAVAPKASP